MTSSASVVPLPGWLGQPRLMLLAVCQFLIGSAAMVMTGLLPVLGQALQIETATAGQLLAAYAAAFAIGTPLAAVLSQRSCRKRLMVLALWGLGLALLAASWTSGFLAMLVARAASGLAAAVFVVNATAVVSALTAPQWRGRALAIVSRGFTLALVLGAPLGTTVGMQFGWRPTFAAMGLATLAAAALLQRQLADGILLPGATAAGLRQVLMTPALRRAMALNLLASFGTFLLLSHAASAWPLLLAAGAGAVAPALALFGLGHLLGEGLSARTLPRHSLARAAAPALGVAASGTAVLALGGLQVLSWGALVAWGAAVYVASAALQTQLISAVPAHRPAAMSLDVAATFLGQALGASAGSWWLGQGRPCLDETARHSAAGLAWIACAALLLAAWGAGAAAEPPAARLRA